MAAKTTLKPGEQLTYSSPDDPILKKGVINTIEILSGRKKVKRIYREIERESLSGQALWDRIFEKFSLNLEYDKNQLNKIPSNGPLVLIANHPFGVIDGLCLGNLLAKRRLDFKLIVNEVLTREEMLKKYLLPIDFRETKQALLTNIQTRKSTIELLLKEHAIGIFPSGAVATTPKIKDKIAVDLEWKRFVIKILHASKATVVPIYFHGQNSKIFQLASHIHPNLRLALIMHEATKKMNTTIKIDIHNPISYEQLPEGMNKVDLLEYLKNKTILKKDS